jgi:hypothetical protein
MNNKDPIQHLNETIEDLVATRKSLKKSPFLELWHRLSLEYRLETELPLRDIMQIRVKIYDGEYNLIGYLDYGHFINLYGGNHYFGLRKSGESVQKGKESDEHFQRFNYLAKNVAEKSKLQLIETSNSGKYGDVSLWDIWSLVPKGAMSNIYSGSKKSIINLCRAWNVDAFYEPRIEFTERAIKKAKEVHQKATKFLEQREHLLKEIGALVLFEEMRMLLHEVYEAPLGKEKKRYQKGNL